MARIRMASPARVGGLREAHRHEHHDRAEEDEDERVQDLVEGHAPGRDAGPFAQLVRTLDAEPRLCIGSRQPATAALKGREHVVRATSVRVPQAASHSTHSNTA